MKQFLFIIVTACFFVGCVFNPEYLKRDYVIYNNSNVKVTFSLVNYGFETHTIDVGKSMKKNMYGTPKLDFKNNRRVLYVSGSDDCQITDMPKWVVKITNNSSQKIVVTENNNMLNEYGSKLEIDGANETPFTPTKKDGIIYTKTPSFSANYFITGEPLNSSGKWENEIYYLSFNDF